MNNKNPKQKEITIADLYPNLSPEEQAEAEENLQDYLEVVWDIARPSYFLYCPFLRYVH